MLKTGTSDSRSHAPSDKREVLFSYLTGLLTAGIIFFLFFLFIGYRGGFANLFAALKTQLFPSGSHKKVLHLPKDVLEELTQRKAPIGNANNPTKVPAHDTFLVRPDNEFTYVLRPNANISVSQLKSSKALNLDPPVLHLNGDDRSGFSERLKRYLKEEALLHYSYSTNSAGFRMTVPNVESDSRILIIGDSVAFGVGVDDDQTAASHLQKLTGTRHKIINAAVGGYNGRQAFLTAKKLGNEKHFSGLIYIVCQNDFMEAEDWSAEARKVLSNISTLSGEFNNKIIIMLVTYMEYNLRDFFLEKGWSEINIKKTDALRKAMPEFAKEFGFAYHDWTDDVSSYMDKEKSIFSRFALYSDHAHLSPLGNRLMAAELFSMLQHK